MTWSMAMEYALLRAAQRHLRYKVHAYRTFVNGRWEWRYGTTVTVAQKPVR